MKIAFTVCNRRQLPHALVLADSLRQHSPEHRFVIGWVDRMTLPTLPDWIEVVYIEKLGIAEWESMQQQYYDFELVAASKPFFAKHLLTTHPGCSELVCFSPTSWVLSPLDQVAQQSAFLQLSPHRLRPIANPRNQLDDKRVLNIGMFQAGSWIMHPDGQEKAMLDWWGQRTADRGYFQLCDGMCLDQLWLNYLPIYHENVEAVRHPGWQHGLHAVPGSTLSSNGRQYFVDRQPLISLEFAGLESHHPVWSDHADLVAGHGIWDELRKMYRKELKKYALPSDRSTAIHGKKAPVKSGRRIRKKIVRWLHSLIHRIAHFDWTHG